MDTLDVLNKAESMGGAERREAMQRVTMMARDRGCRFSVGGGKVGGFNIRYGSINYAVMDVNCAGEVFLHIKPHPSKDITDEEREAANDFVGSLEGITIKNAPINNYGQAEEAVEDIPAESLDRFLEWSVGFIRDRYYNPHRD